MSSEGLEDYVDYEKFVIDKLQQLRRIDSQLIRDEQYRPIRNLRDFEKSLYNNLVFWYLKESKTAKRLNNQAYCILKNSDREGKR